MRRRRYRDSEDEEGSSVSTGDDYDDDEHYDDETAQMAIKNKEEALVQSALQRISRAQAKGKTDVKLNKDELAALDRRRKRMQEEAERKQRSSGSGSDRKKRKEQRVAVPLSQLEPVSRKKKSSKSAQPAHPPRQDSLPLARHSSASDLPEYQDRQVYPPMGYFPPPSSSRSRPHSGSFASQRPPSRAYNDGGSSPFQYDYTDRPPSASRHGSDPMSRPQSSRGRNYEEPWGPNSSSLGARTNVDPFAYQTAGSRVPYPPGAQGVSRRHVSGPAEAAYRPHRNSGGTVIARSRHGSRRPSPDHTSEEGSETSPEGSSSDELGNGARIREPIRGREEIIVEASPEPEPERPKKKSSSSPTKRRGTVSGGGGRRKKK